MCAWWWPPSCSGGLRPGAGQLHLPPPRPGLRPVPGLRSRGCPYHPRQFLRWSRAGLRAGDLTVVAGHPGRTARQGDPGPAGGHPGRAGSHAPAGSGPPAPGPASTCETSGSACTWATSASIRDCGVPSARNACTSTFCSTNRRPASRPDKPMTSPASIRSIRVIVIVAATLMTTFRQKPSQARRTEKRRKRGIDQYSRW